MQDNQHPKPYPQRLLIAGGQSVVGANLAVALAGRFQVLALVDSADGGPHGCRTECWDPADCEGLIERIFRESPHWIIHCGPLAQSSWDAPAECPDLFHQRDLWQRLAVQSDRLGNRLTVISTDAVFAGPRMFRDEKSTPDAATAFATAARRAEQPLLASNALLVRTHAYGWSPLSSRPGFAEWTWQHLSEGADQRFASDRHATPILATDLAELLVSAYTLGLKGLYHVAGAERTSAYRFARELAAAFGLKNFPLSTEQERLPGSKSGNLDETSLNTRKARRALERPMPMLREGLDRFAQQAVNGFRDRLKSAASDTPVRGVAA